MKKIIRLTESDLIRLVKRVIKEQETDKYSKFLGRKVKLVNKRSNMLTLNLTIKNIVPLNSNTVIVEFTEDIIPKNPNKSSFERVLKVDCNEDYLWLWWGCDEHSSYGCDDFNRWINNELVKEIQEILCPPNKSVPI